MTLQTALQVIETGNPLVKVTRPVPVPGAGEIVVKVTSAGRKFVIPPSKIQAKVLTDNS
jgi:hypothetical protein